MMGAMTTGLPAAAAIFGWGYRRAAAGAYYCTLPDITSLKRCRWRTFGQQQRRITFLAAAAHRCSRQPRHFVRPPLLMTYL